MKLAIRHAAIAASALSAVVALPAAATAQNVIPGDLTPGNVVVTSLAGVSVSVTQPDLSRVTVSTTNNSGKDLRCDGPEGGSGIGVTVTPDEVAQAAMQYYANFAYQPAPQDRFGSTGNLGAGDGDLTVDIAWNPILAFLPTGSIAPMFGEAYAARDWIASQHRRAVTQGHAGTSTQFSVNNGTTFTTTVTLNPPSAGPRTDFDAGAFLVCTSGTEKFAFAGYENGPPSPTNDGALPIGSVGRR